MVRVLAAVAIAIGAFWVAAWIAGLAQAWATLYLTVKFNMAVAQIAAGTALLLLHDPGPSRPRTWVGVAAAAFVLGLGAATLEEHVFQDHLGIDELVFAEPAGALGTTHPNRMGPPGSTSLLLLGAGLLSLARRRRLAPYLGVAALLVVLVPAVGFIVRIEQLYSVAAITGIAWPSVLAVSCLGVGLVLASPDSGPMVVLRRDDPGGALARRALPAALLLPVALGFLLKQGEYRGLYDKQAGTGLLVAGLATLLSAFVWGVAARISELWTRRERSVEALYRAQGALRESEASLRRMNLEIDAARENAERARAAAEEATRAKDDFLATLSHELRTPLSPVVSSLAVLLGEPGLRPEVRRRLETIEKNVQLEARLIDDLLDITRIERGLLELHRQPVELVELIERAVDVCRPAIEARRIAFSFDRGTPPYPLHADPVRIQQVFWNLLNNATKFTPEGGRAGVRCRRAGGVVVAEVFDSGAGIDPAELDGVFDAFAQGRAARRLGGLGLGLAISRQMIERHGGTIAAESAGCGAGTTIRLSLPLLLAEDDTVQDDAAGSRAPAAPLEKPAAEKPAAETPAAGTPAAETPVAETPAAETPAAGAPSRGGLQILLVEDHLDSAEVLRDLLSLWHHKVTVAHSISTALGALDGGRFDVLISDLGLPDGSGNDLVREVRSRGQQLPAIALSGYGREDDRQRSLAAGFFLHLVKPVDPGRLEGVLADVAARPPVSSGAAAPPGGPRPDPGKRPDPPP